VKVLPRVLRLEPAKGQVVLENQRITRRAASPGRSSNICCSNQGTRERGSASEAYRKF